MQAEYMNRLDYKWKRQLSHEQEESSTMHMINKMLLQNILPVHVGKRLNVEIFLYVLILSFII
jgi:adenylate cyclase